MKRKKGQGRDIGRRVTLGRLSLVLLLPRPSDVHSKKMEKAFDNYHLEQELDNLGELCHLRYNL